MVSTIGMYRCENVASTIGMYRDVYVGRKKCMNRLVFISCAINMYRGSIERVLYVCVWRGLYRI